MNEIDPNIQKTTKGVEIINFKKQTNDSLQKTNIDQANRSIKD